MLYTALCGFLKRVSLFSCFFFGFNCKHVYWIIFVLFLMFSESSGQMKLLYHLKRILVEAKWRFRTVNRG